MMRSRAGAGPPIAMAANAALVLAAMLWAGNFIAGRAIRDSIDPATLNALRWCLATAVFLPLAGRGVVAHWPLLRGHPGWLVASALTGVVGFQQAIYTALAQTEVANAALLLATTPLMIVASSAAMGRARLGGRRLLAVALSLLGVATILGDGDPRALLSLDLGRGDLWLLCAVACWTIYTQLLRHAPPGLPGDVSLLASMLAGLPILLLLVGLFGRTAILDIPPAAWGGVVYVGLGAALVAFLAWGYGVRRKGPDGAALYLNLIPVFAIALAWLLLGEAVTAGQWAGAAMVFGALLLGGTARPSH